MGAARTVGIFPLLPAVTPAGCCRLYRDLEVQIGLAGSCKCCFGRARSGCMSSGLPWAEPVLAVGRGGGRGLRPRADVDGLPQKGKGNLAAALLFVLFLFKVITGTPL